MAMEDYCTAHDVAGRFIPLPSVVSAGCGMCWSAPPEAEKAVRAAAAAAGITPEGIYQLLL
ncbi:MAG: DUF3343 domain-containing protein [Lachnospiraceae bacterium]|nr:DUF3343 domain-containing protein [Lachnospiraceae bacterium]